MSTTSALGSGQVATEGEKDPFTQDDSIAAKRWSARMRTRLMSMTGRRLTVFLVVSAIVFTGLTGTAIGLAMIVHRQSTVDQASQEALSTAQRLIPLVLSYDYTTIDDNFSSATTNLTGEFHDEFADLARKVIVPAARAESIVTSAAVVESAVVESASDEVTVLMFLNQNTTSTKLSAPRVDGSRVRVDLSNHNGVWLISGINPV